MVQNKLQEYLQNVLQNLPNDWIRLTTHRLDIYNESLAKTQFLEQFETLLSTNQYSQDDLAKLPTAFDYIRLGHPLSCLLEWTIAKSNDVPADNIISFTSSTAPILAVLRKNALSNVNTRICFTDNLPEAFDTERISTIYEYKFELAKIQNLGELQEFNGSTIFVSNEHDIVEIETNDLVDFHINILPELGSIIAVNGQKNQSYISEIQHVRRRETIAMTPANCLIALNRIVGNSENQSAGNAEINRKKVVDAINEICGTHSKALVASSGLSIQYAILMGLVEHAVHNHPGKAIKIIVPPNCYGGTNDQARRVAACLDNVEIVDFPVDAGNDMVQSIESILTQTAQDDAVPFIIAEIPTNPRVEVPNLTNLRDALSKPRQSPNGTTAIDPVFILDQTFCPNVHFLGDQDILSTVRTISFASGSKFPSGGKCTAGYCVANSKAENLMASIQKHLNVCDNQATALQLEILAEQLPSMNERIAKAYANTREFVSFIEQELPESKINFVSEELAAQGFTPSVFSLDLPTKGNTDEEKENYKRALNLKLINMMISEIPNESKYCVSYGQLKGCYWTIPATSTQGTTKEGDKDYIARVALSANMDLQKHKEVFAKFVEQL